MSTSFPYKQILVTGGAGFIGSNFILYLLEKFSDLKIVNFDKLTYAGNLENLKSVQNLTNYQFIKGDICDPKTVNQAIEGCDLIVHFAAETHVDRSIVGPDEFIQTNVIGTKVLLDAAKNNGSIRFHHISTDEVFGSLSPNDSAFTEETRYDPGSPYSASKASSDHLVRAYHHTYNLPVTISNCSNNYGPFQFPEKLIPLFITNLLEGKKVPIYGQGLNIRDWIYVQDHCSGIEAILQKGKIGETYLLGGLSEKTNLEITREILKLLGKSEDRIEYVQDRPGHDFRYAMNIEKAKRKLSWEPKVSLEEGLVKTVEWYKNHQDWWKKIKSKILISKHKTNSK